MKYLLTFYVSFYIISLALRNYLEAITKENALLAQLVGQCDCRGDGVFLVYGPWTF